MYNMKKNETAAKNVGFLSDKIYSTYFWIIALDPTHEKNYNPNVTEITGYSKMQGHDETKDKAQLLMARIVMLFTRGYFERGTHIDFYMRQGELMNKSNCRHLVTLRRKDFELDESLIASRQLYQNFVDKGLLKFLNDFYDCVAHGKNVKYLLPKKSKLFNKDDYFDPAKVHESMKIKTHQSLYAYSEMLIKNGHAFDAVMNFIKKYELNYMPV